MEKFTTSIPPRVGPYNVRGVIGKGAFSVVKLAQHAQSRDFFACKIISKSFFSKPSFAVRFEAEVRVMQQMRHPHVVSLTDVMQDSQYIYIFMEFCPNGELFQHIVDKRYLNEGEAKQFLKQIVEGLRYVHSCNVTHRDIKPENILIDKFGNLKISDFGFAKFVGKNGLVSTSCGSPCYASPECLSGKPYDGYKCDIWSTGVILFAMLTGNLPWTKRNQKELYNQIQNGEYQIPNFVSDDARDLITKMMCVNPMDRIDDAGVLNHPWMKDAKESIMPESVNRIVSLKKIDELFIKQESFFNKDYRFLPITKVLSQKLSLAQVIKETQFPEKFISKVNMRSNPNVNKNNNAALPKLLNNNVQRNPNLKPLAIYATRQKYKENEQTRSQRDNARPTRQITSTMSVHSHINRRPILKPLA